MVADCTCEVEEARCIIHILQHILVVSPRFQLESTLILLITCILICVLVLLRILVAAIPLLQATARNRTHTQTLILTRMPILNYITKSHIQD